MPPLAFGEAIAARTGDSGLAASQTAQTVTALKSYRPLGQGKDFRSKTVSLSINGLGLCANACTPLRAEMEPSDDLYFIVSFRGDCFTEVEGRQYAWRPNERGVLIGESGRRYGQSDMRSIVVARFDRARLESTMEAMRGNMHGTMHGRDAAGASASLRGVRVVDLRFGPVDFASSFHWLCSMIDSYACNERLLEAIGLDDLFYRQLALCLDPDRLVRDALEEKHPQARASAIDDLCDAIRSRLGQHFSMTEMERMTGMSRRSLQAAFNARFGCPPMEWQKRERLRVARQILSNRAENANIADLAFRLGFSSPSRFAAFYREMYGEAPGQTLQRLSATTPNG